MRIINNFLEIINTIKLLILQNEFSGLKRTAFLK